MTQRPRSPRARIPTRAELTTKGVTSDAPPPDDGWRYQMDGAPRWLALFGVAVGFVTLVVPGVFALRSYRRWREGVRLQPSTAWVFGILGGWVLVIAAIVLFTDLLGLAVLVTLVGPPASIVLALRA